MKTQIRAALVAATVIAATGCGAAVKVGADFDPAVSMGKPTTFAWDEPDAVPTGDARLDGNQLFVQRLHAAIEAALAARGIRYDATHPALLVHHHTSVENRVDVIALDRAHGYVESQYGPGTQVIQYDEGTWLVDVADATTRKMLWRGWSRADLTDALEDKKCMNDLIDESVAKMFELFPIPVATSPAVAPAPAAKPDIPAPEICYVPTH